VTSVISDDPGPRPTPHAAAVPARALIRHRQRQLLLRRTTAMRAATAAALILVAPPHP
jgi:hypothetical protein